MKVLNLHAVSDIRLDERVIPEPGENEVLLQVKACSICSSDEDRIFKNGTYHFPTVPGHEFAGKIVKTGACVDDSLVGTKASVFPLLPCFECDSCKSGQYATCSDYKYFGSRNDGGFSEYIVVPEWNLNRIDDSVSYEAAALSEPSAVAMHAVKMGGVKKGDSVVVIGTGTIGILIAGICKYFGAEPLVVGRREASVDMVKSFGLDATETKDVYNHIQDKAIDIVFESVGSNDSMATAIEIVKANGTIVAVGNPKGDFILEKNIYWKILRRQLTVKGTWNSSFKGDDDDWKAIAEMMKSKTFPFEKLITAKYQLDQFEEAFTHLRDKSAPKSRIMFVMNGEE